MATRTTILKIGIASAAFLKARTIAIASGKQRRRPGEPRVWFTSLNSVAQVLSEPNRALLELIRSSKPATMTELAELSGRKESNLSRTLRTMENYGLVRLAKTGRTVRPVVGWDKVEIEVQLAEAA